MSKHDELQRVQTEYQEAGAKWRDFVHAQQRQSDAAKQWAACGYIPTRRQAMIAASELGLNEIVVMRAASVNPYSDDSYNAFNDILDGIKQNDNITEERRADISTHDIHFSRWNSSTHGSTYRPNHSAR